MITNTLRIRSKRDSRMVVYREALCLTRPQSSLNKEIMKVRGMMGRRRKALPSSFASSNFIIRDDWGRVVVLQWLELRENCSFNGWNKMRDTSDCLRQHNISSGLRFTGCFGFKRPGRRYSPKKMTGVVVVPFRG